MSDTDHPQSLQLRIKPMEKWIWGIDEPVFVEGKFNLKKDYRDKRQCSPT